MRHLDQLMRKCRHDPKMGGNTETITLPCTLVARLLGIARAFESMEHGRDLIPIMNAMDQELVWADDEAKAYLTKEAKVSDAG
jgi:hypothetical protein